MAKYPNANGGLLQVCEQPWVHGFEHTTFRSESDSTNRPLRHGGRTLVGCFKTVLLLFSGPQYWIFGPIRANDSFSMVV